MPDMPKPPSSLPSREMRVAPPIGCWLFIKAALGSVLIGVTLPCVLVSLRCLNKPPMGHLPKVDSISVLSWASILCSPGAIVLSVILLAILKGRAPKLTMKQTMLEGAIGGGMMAFLNLPGYFVFPLLGGDTFVEARVALLFAVAGMSCGLWIAWQAWCASRPQEGFLLRFSLRTLLLLVVLWGAVMLAFQPRQWTAPPASSHANDDMM